MDSVSAVEKVCRMINHEVNWIWKKNVHCTAKQKSVDYRSGAEQKKEGRMW